MRKTYHSSIFFPSGKEEMLELIAKYDKKEPHKAIIVPHQDLRKAHESYSEAFRFIPDGKKIIAIVPLHSQSLQADKDSIVYEPEEMDIETPIGPIHLESLGLKKCEHYMQEEFAAELILPYVQVCTPNSKLSVVIARLENAEDSKKMAKLIERWNDEDTFFIISSNLSARMNDIEMLEMEKKKAIKALSEGEKLLDSYRKGRIGICASAIIDALSRVIKGRWKLVHNQQDTTTGHASFYKEEE